MVSYEAASSIAGYIQWTPFIIFIKSLKYMLRVIENPFFLFKKLLDFTKLLDFLKK